MCSIGTGCASVATRSSCSWLEVVDEPAAQATALRVTQGEEAPCTKVGAPGVFRIGRPEYAIDFWNGDRWYPELFLRARSSTGDKLTLRSPQLSAALGRGVIRPANDYDYYWPSSDAVPDRINFSVVDSSGREIGRESIRLTLKSGGSFRSWPRRRRTRRGRTVPARSRCSN
jgi:hypothetical protein